jgi:hypothetical protein
MNEVLEISKLGHNFKRFKEVIQHNTTFTCRLIRFDWEDLQLMRVNDAWWRGD